MGVRKRQKRMSNVAESGEEHSIIWGMFMAATMSAATFMGKNFSTIQSVVKNLEDLTLKQPHKKNFSGIQELVSSFARGRIWNIVEVGQILCGPTHRITTIRFAGEYSALRDDTAAEAKGALGDNTISFPIHDARISLHYGRYGIEVQIDFVSGDGSKSWAVISRGLDRCVTEISAGCKQFMYLEAATRQDATSNWLLQPDQKKTIATFEKFGCK